jgi:hypothetical protein
MIDDKNQNGWNEYSKLVLRELERLNESYETIREEIGALRSDVNKNETETLKKWKNNVDEVFSPTQMKELHKDVSELKSFKTSSMTIFWVIQFLMALMVALSKFII